MAAWIWWTSGGVLALVGLWTLWWSLWRDRSRGRRRCPKCWYDMADTPGLACPECGQDAKKERRLFRTRRRWRSAVVGLVLCAGPFAASVSLKIRAHGVWAVVPGVLLVRFVESDAHTGSLGPGYVSGMDPALDELIRRGGVRAVPASQWPFFLRHTGAIDPPATWIAGEEVPIRLNSFDWAPRVEIHVRSGKARGVAGRTWLEEFAGFYMVGSSRNSVLLEPLELGRSTVVCHVEIVADALDGSGEETLWEGECTFAIDAVAESTWRYQPVADAAVDAEFRDSIFLDRESVEHGSVVVHADVLGLRWNALPDPDVTWFEPQLSMLVEGEELIFSSQRPPPSDRGVWTLGFDWRFELDLEEKLLHCEPELRIVGLAPTIAEGKRTRRYWAGEVRYKLIKAADAKLTFEPVPPPP